MEAWHFITEDRRNSRTLLPVEIGVTERVAGAIIPERWGLHASAEAADAVFWAPGLCVCRVRLCGEIVGGRQKVAASERTVLWMADARAAVWEWLCLCAEAALARTRIFDEAPKAAIAARRLWIGRAAQGEAAMNDLRATLRRCLHRACGQNADGKRCADGDPNVCGVGRGGRQTVAVERRGGASAGLRRRVAGVGNRTARSEIDAFKTGSRSGLRIEEERGGSVSSLFPKSHLNTGENCGIRKRKTGKLRGGRDDGTPQDRRTN